jgi:hypothetical protein
VDLFSSNREPLREDKAPGQYRLALLEYGASRHPEGQRKVRLLDHENATTDRLPGEHDQELAADLRTDVESSAFRKNSNRTRTGRRRFFLLNGSTRTAYAGS